MTSLPQTLKDVIEEEAERLIKYLNIQKIADSKNPYREFLKQFFNKFGSKNGLNLTQYLYGTYSPLNKIYKNKEIQDKLSEQFKGPIKRVEVLKFFDRYEKNLIKSQNKKEIKEARTKELKEYTRNGKIIKSHFRSQRFSYNQRQERFLKTRKGLGLGILANDFNKYFNTSLTRVALRDKRRRLLR